MITISDTLPKTLANFICYLNAIDQEITTIGTENQSNFMVNRKSFLNRRLNFMFLQLAVNNMENLLGITQEKN